MESGVDPAVVENANDAYRSVFKALKSARQSSEFVCACCKDKKYLDASNNCVLLTVKNCREKFSAKNTEFKERCSQSLNYGCLSNNSCSPIFGVNPPVKWKIYDFSFPSGLILLRNVFSSEGERYWISRSLLDFPNHPHITNIDNLERLIGNSDSKSSPSPKRRKTSQDKDDEFYRQLRWVTFGYHHDWDTKVYREENKCAFPEDLKELLDYVSHVLGFSKFSAEAAIVNYYHLNSTLSGHVDKSEENKDAPLFSLSFGQPAIFLIGGPSKEITPLPVLLRSGDIAIMSGDSRHSYHGVPKILKLEEKSWLDKAPSDKSMYKLNDDSVSSIITNNVQPSLDTCKSGICEPCESYVSNYHFLNKNIDFTWTDFMKSYIAKSRINLNVRQVLFAGQTKLSS